MLELASLSLDVLALSLEKVKRLIDAYTIEGAPPGLKASLTL